MRLDAAATLPTRGRQQHHARDERAARPGGATAGGGAQARSIGLGVVDTTSTMLAEGAGEPAPGGGREARCPTEFRRLGGGHCDVPVPMVPSSLGTFSQVLDSTNVGYETTTDLTRFSAPTSATS